MKLRPISLAALALVSSLAAHAADERRSYIVRLADEPATSYTGGVAGYSATQAVQGRRFVFQADHVQAYVGYLDSQQQQVINLVAGVPVIARYNTVLNGFAARLTDAELLRLKADPRVAAIAPDQALQVQTSTTPKFLGLSEPGGLWSQTGANGLPNTGEGMVIGVIDTGVQPENPAFADRVDAAGTPTFDASATLAYGPPPATWNGSCVSGEGFDPARHCNNKLIGAKYFNEGAKAYFDYIGSDKHWTEFYSPRDGLSGPEGHGGHGTHTASTAGGNSGVPTIINGVPMGNASGIAPRARVAMYKVCYTYAQPSGGSANSCFQSDSVAAIETAVQDGVNVINFSISGSQTDVGDIVEQAFLKASNAGIFVAAAGANAGPANTVNHISPWLTTVAASTHDRAFIGDATLGNGVKYTGASMNTSALPSKPLILASEAALAGVPAAEAELCYLSRPTTGGPVLDAAKVAGKIVVCQRGTNARVEKSQAVLASNGAGMILMDDGNGPVAEAHSVPTVAVSKADGLAIKSYAAGAAGSAALGAFYYGTKPAPVIAAFSSRGPNLGDPNVMKPDFTAPGVDVIAGYSPGLTQPQRDAVAAGTAAAPATWAMISGTSMATPHVAGLAALLKQAHPTWSPAAIKSALATTTRPTLDDGLTGLMNGRLPWSQGTGHVVPNKATDPGLVYDAGAVDWTRYQCLISKASVPAADCSTYGALDASYNLNLPSITVAFVPGSVTVTRTVTNVGTATATYTATASVPGFSIAVSPSTLTLAPGESKSFTATITNQSSSDGAWAYGSLVWSDGAGHTVTSPVAVKMGKSITLSEQVTANTASGSRLMTAKTGFAGRMGIAKGGLKDVTMSDAATLVPFRYSATQLGNACAYTGAYYLKVHEFNIPAGTMLARFELRQQDVGGAADDHDMVVLSPTGKATWSGNDGSNEMVQLVDPMPGNWRVCVGLYSGKSPSTHKLSSWLIGAGDKGGNFNVLGPTQVYVGGTATVGLSWSGLATGGRYIGAAQFKDLAGTTQATTAVRVETNGGLPLATPPVSAWTKGGDAEQ